MAHDEFRIGARVHYALDTMSANPGACRPAVISRIWAKGSETNAVQLTVFADGSNDYPGTADANARWVTSATQDVMGAGISEQRWAAGTPRSWHWPDECADAN